MATYGLLNPDGNYNGNQSLNGSRISTSLVLDDSPDTFWGITDRDFPILIGAVAGALGLIFLILGAVVIWFCCQFTLKRQKSVYSLDNESERGSVSSQGSTFGQNGESVIFVGVKSFEDDESNNNANNNIKRSVSAPLHNASSNGTPFMEGKGKPFVGKGPAKSMTHHHQKHNQSNSRHNNSSQQHNINNSQQSHLQKGNGLQSYAYTNMSQDMELENCADLSTSDSVKILSTSRSHLYIPAQNDKNDEILKTRSLPWRHNKRVSAEAEDVENFGSSTGRVNFTKKRKNRMRNDSAAAIALNRSGETPSRMPFLHKDTDSLVDNEAIVVYDERTAL